MGALRATTVAGITSLLLVGCRGDEPTSTDAGVSTTGGGRAQQLFAGACGSCHALSAAGTQGSVGPPLDNTTLDADAIARQIETGARGMPANIVRGEDKSAVAGYIAEQARLGK